MKSYSFNDRLSDYRKAYHQHGVHPRALQWNSTSSMDLRLKQIVKDIDFSGKSILDVGCGFGLLLDYIKTQTKDFSYVGVDLVPEFIQEAHRLYPQHRFINQNYYENPLSETFDIVIASGSLNYNQGPDTIKIRQQYIQTLFDHTSYALVFNMAGFYPQPQNDPDSKIYYADSLDILNYCFTLTSKIIFRHHYDPLDFTLCLFR